MTQSIFVTGASSGIGRAAATLFAERGWFVGVFDVNPGGLSATEAAIPPSGASRALSTSAILDRGAPRSHASRARLESG